MKNTTQKKDLKALWVSPEVHKGVKTLAAQKGTTINILIHSLIVRAINIKS